VNASQAALIVDLQQQIVALKHQLDWLKRQLFGTKSERFVALDPQQMHLGEVVPLPVLAAPTPVQTVATHQRKQVMRDGAAEGEALPFFDESRVPIETITLANPEVAGLSADQFEVIGQKVTFRLAQRPAATVVLKYVRPVIKRLATQKISCPSPPSGVIEGSRADVSFCTGLLVDKFVYHLPLYRQHLRLKDAGITVSRPWLTQIAQACIALLEPIYDSQFDSIRASRVIAMDETAIKAGRHQGKMKAAYFWPVFGDQDAAAR